MRRSACVAALCAILVASSAWAELRLPAVFSDHMVLQREAEVKVWGWATPDADVTVEFAGQSASTKAAADGTWSVSLKPMATSAEGRALTVKSDTSITVQDVVVGEVWHCSGQSNMEWSISRSQKPEGMPVDMPMIRHFKTPKTTSVAPRSNLTAKWVPASAASVPSFTGVGYHFALTLHAELGVPVGLLNTSWGGSRIEPFISLEGMQAQDEAAAASAKEVTALINIVENMAAMDQSHLDAVKDWVARAEAAIEAGSTLPGLPKHPAPKPSAQSLAMKFNAMVHPLIPYTIRGALWYQGESNMGDPAYAAKKQAMIDDWRTRWDQGEFPFYFVQLAPYKNYMGTRLGLFWEQQSKVLSMVKNTGMAVTTDISTLRNIHPPNKTDVGRRLAFWALHHDYGQAERVYTGPVYSGIEVEGAVATLSFDHAKGLNVKDGVTMNWFEIAGADKVFHPATAEIVGETIQVRSDAVTEAVAVRLAWGKNVEPAIYNAAGIPASPFRTDSW